MEGNRFITVYIMSSVGGELFWLTCQPWISRLFDRSVTRPVGPTFVPCKCRLLKKPQLCRQAFSRKMRRKDVADAAVIIWAEPIAPSISQQVGFMSATLNYSAIRQWEKHMIYMNNYDAVRLVLLCKPGAQWRPKLLGRWLINCTLGTACLGYYQVTPTDERQRRL